MIKKYLGYLILLEAASIFGSQREDSEKIDAALAAYKNEKIYTYAKIAAFDVVFTVRQTN